MKSIPNNMVSDLARYLPLLLANIDEAQSRKSLRLANAIRKVKHEILPKLNKINKLSNGN